MHLLITGAASPLGTALSAGLRQRYALRLTDWEPLETELEFVRSDLGHDGATDALVAGIDAVVHLAYAPRPGDGETTWLDANSRRTYNLLLAASKAGVDTAVVVSALDFFLSYDEDMTVSENWKPLPSTDPAQLGAHLAEFTAREFAHSHALDVVVARLGHVVRADAVAGLPYDPLWIEERDAVQAVDLILQKRRDLDQHRASNYHVLHFQSASARARFSCRRARSALGFAPQYNFEANP